MTDKTGPLNDDDVQDETLESTQNDSENDVGDSEEDRRQKRFAAIFSRLMDGFGEACEKEGVTIAVAIAQHPEAEQPMVFYRAPHICDAGALMAGILREIKTDVFASLDTEPQ